MKVVLFCGGLGTRMREHSDTVPKSLINIGTRPIVWHLMRYYAHYGHKEFILCLGYRGDLIREYFLDYREELTNDFTLNGSDRSVALHSQDIKDWKITFVDTGLHSNIGQRLLRAKKYLQGEDLFLANYADGLSDVPIDRQIAEFQAGDGIGSFVAVRSSQSFHAVQMAPDGHVTSMGAMPDQELWINGGFFVFRKEIFSYIDDGDELVEKPFARLIAEQRLIALRWSGFWQCMDTFKDKISLDRMEAKNECPWKIWSPMG
jgi:glucose-1-phosphate cytidylyltransferase